MYSKVNSLNTEMGVMVVESERFRIVFTTYSNSYSRVFHEYDARAIRRGYDVDTTQIRTNTREYSVLISNYTLPRFLAVVRCIPRMKRWATRAGETCYAPGGRVAQRLAREWSVWQNEPLDHD